LPYNFHRVEPDYEEESDLWDSLCSLILQKEAHARHGEHALKVWYWAGYEMEAAIKLSTTERSEKERIIERGDSPVRLQISLDWSGTGFFESVFEQDIIEASFFGLLMK
jgi:hypothetical protein